MLLDTEIFRISLGTEYLPSAQLKEAKLDRQFLIMLNTCCYRRRGAK